MQRKQNKETKKLKNKIITWKQRYEKVKKCNIRLQRANLDSPEVKTQKILQGQRVNTQVWKTLRYHFAVLGALKQKYKTIKDTKSKQSLAQLVSEKLLKKYKCTTYCKNLICCDSRTIRKTKQIQETGIHLSGSFSSGMSADWLQGGGTH